MTDINKDKIRIEDTASFEDEHTLTSNKFTPKEFKEFIASQLEENIQNVLYNTGETHIYFDYAILNLSCMEKVCGTFKFCSKFEVNFLNLESDIEHKNRLYKLECEEAYMKELATKFGYKLEKVNE
jgi:hypothetical protein